jgi:hypothetical protein
MRCCDILGGAAILAATAGLGHGVTHVANQAITYATYHALSYGQHTLTNLAILQRRAQSALSKGHRISTQTRRRSSQLLALAEYVMYAMK